MIKIIKNHYEVGLLTAAIFLGVTIRFRYSSIASFNWGFWSILLDSLNIFLFFLLTKRLFSTPSVPLFLTFVFSILPWSVQLSRDEGNKTLALVLTNIFFLIVYWSKKLPNLKKIFPIFVLFILASLILTIGKLPTNNLPFSLSTQEVEQIKIYRGFLNPVDSTFSRLYSNKASVVLKNVEVNFFETVDINNYFFANHPLERVGVKETEKFYSGLLPLFILGILYLSLSIDSPIILWSGFIFLSSGFFSNRYYGINSLLIIPFLIIIGRGLQRLLEIKRFSLRAITLLPIFTWLLVEIIIFGLNSKSFF